MLINHTFVNKSQTKNCLLRIFKSSEEFKEINFLGCRCYKIKFENIISDSRGQRGKTGLNSNNGRVYISESIWLVPSPVIVEISASGEPFCPFCSTSPLLAASASKLVVETEITIYDTDENDVGF